MLKQVTDRFMAEMEQQQQRYAEQGVGALQEHGQGHLPRHNHRLQYTGKATVRGGRLHHGRHSPCNAA